jgi:hypothetical protein
MQIWVVSPTAGQLLSSPSHGLLVEASSQTETLPPSLRGPPASAALQLQARASSPPASASHWMFVPRLDEPPSTPARQVNSVLSKYWLQ